MEAHDEYAAIEDVSFWFRHRNRCILAMMEAHRPDGAIFDIGGGNGCVAAVMSRAGFEVVLVEPGLGGARNAQKRGVSQIVCATTGTARFKPQSMPAIGLFDVVEHTQDDGAFLREMAELLQQNGLLFATVPAHQWLWSDEDERAGHFRRYTLESLKAVTEAAGLDVAYLSYFFRPLPLPILLLRTLPFQLGHRRAVAPSNVSNDHMADQGVMSLALNMLLSGEVSHVRQSRVMRFGGSILLAARKRRGAVR
jgi:SAM-dependent methyltransferase